MHPPALSGPCEVSRRRRCSTLYRGLLDPTAASKGSRSAAQSARAAAASNGAAIAVSTWASASATLLVSR